MLDIRLSIGLVIKEPGNGLLFCSTIVKDVNNLKKFSVPSAHCAAASYKFSPYNVRSFQIM